ncbi:tyrosine-type recombinase/integrase [Sphingomonas xinjiangensis]|uniref:Site-specific recombinase XerD n=1 Tax=Sphingomonas xinjiangensis TaxID=643568 RepID=A0A840YHN1_9SPHN|nr:tyrosine-type recombinase/integrase [Sphingomonas xinjiangensis]MBB5711875.1 site-specific recombinase XerD [Sphingomonas xinjiangensis]
MTPTYQSLDPCDDAGLHEVLRAEIECAASNARAQRAPATRRAYASDWRIFLGWCETRGVASLPTTPAIVAAFLAFEADRGIKANTVGRRLAAIGYNHRRAGLHPPQEQPGARTMFDVVAGLRKALGADQASKQPVDAQTLWSMLGTIEGNDLRSLRDRAALVLGMASALPRSKLVSIAIADVVLSGEILTLRFGPEKGQQAGEGTEILIREGSHIRPVSIVSNWIATAGHIDGPLFRRLTRAGELTVDPMSDRSIARLIKRCAAAAGLNPAFYAGHSLRSGFLIEAAQSGASICDMQIVSGHKSAQFLSKYVRDAARSCLSD